jgi:hypothetical protein
VAVGSGPGISLQLVGAISSGHEHSLRPIPGKRMVMHLMMNLSGQKEVACGDGYCPDTFDSEMMVGKAKSPKKNTEKLYFRFRNESRNYNLQYTFSQLRLMQMDRLGYRSVTNIQSKTVEQRNNTFVSNACRFFFSKFMELDSAVLSGL